MSAFIEHVIHSGAYRDARDVISAALEPLAEDLPLERAASERRAAIERLKIFGKTHGLSLGDMTLRQLRHEARP